MNDSDDWFGDGEFAPKIRSYDPWLARKEAELAEFIERIKNRQNRQPRSWNAEFFELINAQNVEWIAVQIHAGALLRIFD